jgi:uracil-DNA glycosylase
MMSAEVASGWEKVLKHEFEKSYMHTTREFLRREYHSGAVVYPPKDKIFRALKLVDYDDVRVVILGQDPYHGPDQANGLAFAVNQGLRTPPSLLNIFKEVQKEFQVEKMTHTTLEGWAKQGVLMLNTVLTVRAGQAFSHRGQGWETFTDTIIEKLNERAEPIVFILWGSPAQKKAAIIKSPHHFILKSPHPSPLSAHRGFFGNDHFIKTNEFLKKHGKAEIDWTKS